MQRVRRLTLRKEERLYERKLIEQVFHDGKSVTERPVKLIWLVVEHGAAIPVKAAFTVPSRNFKRAVDRNLLKRRMREAYRKNKSMLAGVIQKMNAECLIMFVYTDVKKCEYAEIESKIVVTLQRLIKQLSGK